jgi:hypothetical protein
MADKTQSMSLSIENSKADWLKNQKKLTGLSESYFVDQGLDVVMVNTQVTILKESFMVLFYFFISIMFFIFDIIFSNVLSVSIFLLVFLFSSVGILISGIGLYKVLKTWKKIK